MKILDKKTNSDDGTFEIRVLTMKVAALPTELYPSPCWHKYNFKKIKWIKIKTGLSLVYCKPLVGKTDTKGMEQSETMYLTLDLTTISLGGKMDVSRNSDDYQVWYELLQPFPFRGQVELKMSMLNVYACFIIV